MDRWEEQTWEDFEKAIKGKKVFLFGATPYADVYFRRYGRTAVLDGVIDNNRSKQGSRIGEFIPEAWGLEQGEMKISDISALSPYQADEAAVLVASRQYYAEIAKQLEEFGVYNCFILLFLERNGQKASGVGDLQGCDEIARKKEFADECCRKEPIDTRKIFFRAYGDYADHGKYITDALLKIRDDLDIVWVVSDWAAQLPEGVRRIYGGNWKQYIYEMETAKVWVLDLAVPDFIKKRQGQVYLQTKHWASITLKKFYLDTVTLRDVPQLVATWKRDGAMIDHIITGSDFDTESCRRGFGFQGKALQYGSPRSDALFHERENKEKIYDYYGLDREGHILLYAPTYRFDKEKGKTVHAAKELELDLVRTKRALENRFGGQWCMLLRLHPSVSRAYENMEWPDFVVNSSRYPDSQELVAASDILISDFSSIMFEPAFVKKPVFLFATDLQDYITNEYELLIKYEALPFPKAGSNQELEQCILNFDEVTYRKEVTEFLDSYGVHEDGHASQRAAEFISGLFI